MALRAVDPPPDVRGSALLDAFGKPMRVTTDPAWQPPRDPLSNGAASINAEAIRREIPISVVATGWDVPGIRAARQQAVVGLFDMPAQMVDAVILTDARTQAGLASRLSILGRPVEFVIPKKYRDSSLAKECLESFENAWPEMATEPVMSELQRWAVMLGFGVAQNLWDFSGEYAIPHPQPWHPRYVYYHWTLRCMVAMTQDAQEPIIPGDASWIMHAPHGEHRGWMRGAAFAIAPWWLGRAYALRDWMRWSERHGLPILKLKRPALGDPYQAAFMRSQMANLSQEAVLDLPQNPPPALSFDVELLEAKGTAHEGFRMLIEQCNGEITLAIVYQQLTTSMPAEGGSSYAAARVHAGVLQGALEADARALSYTVYRQLARPFAAINFGNADLAPRVVWDVTPFEDAKTKALAFMQIAQAINYMRIAGVKMTPKGMRRMIRNTIPGFDPGVLEAIQPVQIEAQAARAGAVINADESEARGGSRSRIANLMSRISPAVERRIESSRARFFDAEEEGLREALAEIEHEQARLKRKTA